MFRQGSTCPAVLVKPTLLRTAAFRIRGFHPLWRAFPDASPTLRNTVDGLLRVRSPLLAESLLMSVPGLLRWFTSPSVAPPRYFIHARGDGIAPAGLPHSEIHGSKGMCTSPWLIAAYHVLRRLSAPRHPPLTHASLDLIIFSTSNRGAPSKLGNADEKIRHTQKK